MSLNNQSNRLSELERRDEALAAIEEATAIYRSLAEARPDAFLPAFTRSLTNQAGRLSEFERYEEALAAIEEALETAVPVLEREPDTLSDSGVELVKRYLELCEQVRREPGEELVDRMYEVLVSAGILTAEE